MDTIAKSTRHGRPNKPGLRPLPPLGGGKNLRGRFLEVSPSKKPPLVRTLTLAGQSTTTHVQLQVRDTGKGMSADQLTQVFEPLYTTKDGGTGLGLYIVQEVVTAHEGRVTVESVEGQGTTFSLTLPVAIDAISQTSNKMAAR